MVSSSAVPTRAPAGGLGLVPAIDGDAFVAHVQRRGLIFAHRIGGPGLQTLWAFTAGANGTANALVGNTSLNLGQAVMHVGDRTFDDGQGHQLYLLNISL
jgi:hypothetical protein